ncbi:MAG: Re/Si-specific NAD(P)(+) transhydrogenase subunit alpha [Alphaproteobacteria bacterium]|nr:Re/Si-specific NAD(P)(+) transhydrogenase subunit alpha [Alphaproteobacteria bacterium]
MRLVSKIAIIKEPCPQETRVAATPETVKKFAQMGFDVIVESNAGEKANYLDGDYKDAGATIAKTPQEAIKNANIVLRVQINSASEIENLKKDALLIGLFNPFQNKELVEICAKQNITALSMELVPRISRAQSMDVLSSQANLAGYKAVLDATQHYARAFPMMMTAAGTIAPAKVFVMGAGVAGLQAIATAKRLGAVVSATDVRPAAKEQVQSLGAKFVAVEDEEFKKAETSGGYAKEMSKAYQKKQAALVEETIAKQDVVITTALIPGRAAPKLISEKMVKSMKPGSVIVDMATSAGGNVELSEGDKVIQKHDVTIIGHQNIPARLATDASALYAKNLLNFVSLITEEKNKKAQINMDWEDEIIKGVALTHKGKIIHPHFVAPAKSPSKKTSAKKPAKKTTSKTAKKSTKKSTKTKKVAKG